MKGSIFATGAGTVWLTIGAASGPDLGWMTLAGFVGLALIWWGWYLRGHE